MSRRTIVTVILALVFAGAATVAVQQIFSQKAEEAPKIETVEVVVAATDIARGRLLTDGDVKVVEWHKALIPDGAMTDREEAIGRSAISEIVREELLFERKLANKDAGHGLAALVPAGMRAFTIHTPTASAGVGGFIVPGSKVDVLLTVTSSGGADWTGGGTTTTLLECVEILAVDHRLDSPAATGVNLTELKSALVWQLPSAVTLLVTPHQAAILGLAMDKGTLHLTLRNPEDDAAADPEPVTLADIRLRQGTLVARSQKEASSDTSGLPRPPELPLEVRTLRGRQHGQIQVDEAQLVSGSR